jgi:hypothetical protein
MRLRACALICVLMVAGCATTPATAPLSTTPIGEPGSMERKIWSVKRLALDRYGAELSDEDAAYMARVMDMKIAGTLPKDFTLPAETGMVPAPPLCTSMNMGLVGTLSCY